MSITQSPYGLSFFDYKGGKNRMSTTDYYIQSGTNGVSVGQGDPVSVSSTVGYVVGWNGQTAPTAPAQANIAGSIVGVAVSFSWVSTTGVHMKNQSYLPAGTQTLNLLPITVKIADLFSNVYRIQCNGPFGLTAPATAIFHNYNFTTVTATPANPNNSQSLVQLDTNSSGVAPPNYWLNAKIVGLSPAITSGGTNSWYDPYPDVLVMINNHAYKPGTNGTA